MGYVTPEQPYGQPAGREQIVITVTLGEQVRTPMDVVGAVGRALTQVDGHLDYDRVQTPFSQQPGFPSGEIKDRDGVIVGSWEVRES